MTGMTKISLGLLIMGNNKLESDKKFHLRIVDSLPDRVIVGDPGQTTVTIKDDDGELNNVDILQYFVVCIVDITVRFKSAAYSVNEDKRQVQPVLVLSNPSSTNITVQVTDTENTATSE